MDQPELITSQEQLDALCGEWRAAGRFAFDTEFIRDDSFDANLCLVQVSADGDVVLVDPLDGLDMTPFWDLVCDPEVATVVHAGKEDFELCLRQTGQPPRNVFDVQIASGLVGYDYPMSLTRLVFALRRRRLAKAQTMTDWLRRPLTPEQIQYAIDDVLHLPAIHKKLVGKLKECGRTAWAAEEFARFEDPRLYAPPSKDRVFKIKGAKKLDALGLVVMARLIEWRDEWAAERNRPIRAMMRDDVLVDIARRRPRKPEQLRIIRGFHQAKNGKIVNELLTVIAEAGQTPKEQWPTPYQPREETPMMRAATDLLTAVLRAVCHEEGVAQELVGGAQRLRELLDHARGQLADTPPLLTGWRAEFIGQKLVDLLRGGSEVHLRGWPDALHLGIVETEQ